MTLNRSNRIAICTALVLGLLAAPFPAAATAATATPVSSTSAKHAKGATKLHVHVVGAAGHSVGHARLSIRRVAAKKPRMTKTTNGHGKYTSANLPAGNYKVTARHHGFHAATGSLEVTGAGTHKMTIRMGKSVSVAATRVVHARTAHALGTKAVVKKAAVPAAKELTKKPAAHTPPVKSTGPHAL